MATDTSLFDRNKHASAAGRDLVYLLESILQKELEQQQTRSNSPSLQTQGTLNQDEPGDWGDLDEQRRLLLQRLEVIEATDRELLRRFSDVKQSVQCTTPALETFWGKVWHE